MDLLVSSDQPWFCIVLHNHIVTSLETDLRVRRRRGREIEEKREMREKEREEGEEEGGQREGRREVVRGRSGTQFTVEPCEMRDLPVRCQLP